jgi:hypothetical protein
VQGKTTPLEWLKLRVDPSSPDVFSWSHVVPWFDGDLLDLFDF